MMKRLLVLLLAGCFCSASQGCTSQAWYEGFRENQRQDCYKYKNQKEIQECLDRANGLTYDQYEKARENSEKKPE
jgi:hypothetical protein